MLQDDDDVGWENLNKSTAAPDSLGLRIKVNVPDQYINTSEQIVNCNTQKEMSGPIDESTASGECKVQQPVDGAAGQQVRNVTEILNSCRMIKNA